MSFFLYLTGLAGGAALFFYIVSLYNSERRKIKPLKKDGAPAADGSRQITKQQPIFTIPPGERMCPLCRSMLTKHEALYASRVAFNDANKLMILGCRYCYKDDEQI
ncbi:MAG: hypothetical protein LBT84_03935 [Spirochaetia bacterium]|jgi:hypothetical protein|nr:hypothetical protein [Spirochaetia bacterium]